MKKWQVSILFAVPAVIAVLMVVTPRLADFIAIMWLLYILLLGAATLGWFIIPVFNYMDDHWLVPGKRVRERVRILFGFSFAVPIALVQSGIATFLLTNEFSPLRPIGESTGAIEVLLSSPSLLWALWGAGTYLLVYWSRERVLI